MPQVKDQYDRAETVYDDGVYMLRQMTLVPGLVLNNTYGIPHFRPERAYLVVEGGLS